MRNLSRNLATKYADGHVITDDDLQIMGRMLWNLLGVENDFDAAQKAAARRFFRLLFRTFQCGLYFINCSLGDIWVFCRLQPYNNKIIRKYFEERSHGKHYGTFWSAIRNQCSSFPMGRCEKVSPS